MKKEYITPQLIAVTFATERGYASSGGGLTQLFFMDEELPASAKAADPYTEHNAWKSGTDHFWD